MSIIDLPPWALTCVLVLFGLVFGSFANVLIHRLPQEDAKDRDVVTVPSHCPICGKNIRWFHNLPVISWLCLRGKCAYCGWNIPVRYPIVELLTGALFGVSLWIFPIGTIIWLKGIICGYALIVLFFTDLTDYILPDALQFPLIALGLLFTLPQILWPHATIAIYYGNGWELLTVSAFHNGLQSAPLWEQWRESVTLRNSLIGAIGGYGFPWAFNFAYVKIRNALAARLSDREPLESAMGMGDFKMLAWLGAFWGWEYMLGIFFTAAVLMCVFILPIHFVHRRDSSTMYPFGCGIALATPLIVFWGPTLWRVYYGSSTLKC
jgi:prepilin signal peptidase PulO-like enzyme (type II secretory pathway)